MRRYIEYDKVLCKALVKTITTHVFIAPKSYDVQECDATGDAMTTNAGLKKIILKEERYAYTFHNVSSMFLT